MTALSWLHLDFLDAWQMWGLLVRAYFVFLLAGALYTIYLLIQTGLELRRLAKKPRASASLATTRLFELGGRLETIRQFIILLALLFGIFSAFESFGTLRAVKLSYVSLSAASIDIFGPVVEFAFAVSTILAIVHGFQWFVAARFMASLRESTASASQN
jgi:hypothetical protein